jgi:hypothetical protein
LKRKNQKLNIMKTLTLLVVLVLLSFASYAQDLTGKWSGSLTVQGTQLRLVFNIEKQGEKYNTTIDSPDQNVSGITVDNTSFNYPDIKFDSPAIGMSYEAKVTNNAMEGAWMQAGQSFPLTLSKEPAPTEGTATKH